MSEQLEDIIKAEQGQMDKAIDHLQHELLQIRTGKASPTMVSGVKVDYYGTMTPVNQVANVSTSDSRTLVIQPWEKTMIPVIERAIFEANLGLTPQNDGDLIRITIPPLTEERRKDLVKQCRSYGEDARVGIRAARHKALDAVKKEVKDGFPEDAGKRKEDQIEEMTKKAVSKVEQILDAKETDIMTV
jgi:ribosome recycling factor